MRHSLSYRGQLKSSNAEVTAENWGAQATSLLVSAASRNELCVIVDLSALVFNRARWRIPAQSR